MLQVTFHVSEECNDSGSTGSDDSSSSKSESLAALKELRSALEHRKAQHASQKPDEDPNSTARQKLERYRYQQ